MRSKIPTILAILLLVGGVVAGVFMVSTTKTFRLGASPDTAPQDVRVTNIGSDTFTVSWVTDKPTAGYLKYGTVESNLSLTTPTAEVTNVHWIQVTGATPATQYFLKINSGGTDYDNSGIAWTARTGASLGTEPASSVISGSVVDTTGQPATNTIVYVNVTGVSPLSALTSATGGWIVALNTARTIDLSNYANITADSPLEILVQGGPKGVSTAKALPKSANPTPTIRLGQTFDFRNEPGSVAGDTPSAQIELPEKTATPSSQFNVDKTSTSSSETKKAEVVTVQSVKEGEKITTTSPEFIGSGPVGTKITIKVQSTVQTATVTVGQDGTWTWDPPKDLEPGTHTLTISWKDAKGILQTLTRTFVVEALAAEPAFVSTPSATPRATVKPTATPSSRVTYPATNSALPVSGSLTPTLMLSMMGIGLVLTSFVIYKRT